MRLLSTKNFLPPTEAFHLDDYVDMKYDNNPYIQSLLDTADLKILQPDLVKQAYQTNKELGLFHLFLPPTLIESFRQWTEISMLK